jgi:hypothetical protein
MRIYLPETMFSYRKIHDDIWTSPREGQTTRLKVFQEIKDGIQLDLIHYISEGLIVILTTIW